MKYVNVLLGASIVGFSLAIACAAAAPAYNVAAYQAEQLACVAEAGTRAEADTCRAAVKVRWFDGGAP